MRHIWVDDFPNFPEWDMLVSWRVISNISWFLGSHTIMTWVSWVPVGVTLLSERGGLNPFADWAAEPSRKNAPLIGPVLAAEKTRHQFRSFVKVQGYISGVSVFFLKNCGESATFTVLTCSYPFFWNEFFSNSRCVSGVGSQVLRV